ncbi:MAG: (Fe-S)-binding protein, partial [Candidatus Hodarchaeales archaeon]
EALAIINSCFQCGSCTGTCPLRKVSKYNPREIIHAALLGKTLKEDDLTTCLTCAQCLEVCPQGINFPEFIRLTRSNLGINEENFAHHNIFNLLASISTKTDTGLNFSYEGKTDLNSSIAYFPGCIDLFDRFLDLKDVQIHNIGQSAINIMNKVGIKPNLISLKCCGHDAYWTGDQDSYDEVRQYNTGVIKEAGITTLIVSCAECYYTFEKLYGLKDLKIQHISQFIEEHKDSLGYSGENRILTYHDPCRLGRYMKEYESPRRVLKESGATLKELANNRQFSNCCGVSAWLKCDDVSRGVMLQKLEEATHVVGDDGTLIVGCTKCFAHLNCVLEDKKPQHKFQLQIKDIGMIIDELTTGK